MSIPPLSLSPCGSYPAQDALNYRLPVSTILEPFTAILYISFHLNLSSLSIFLSFATYPKFTCVDKSIWIAILVLLLVASYPKTTQQTNRCTIIKGKTNISVRVNMTCGESSDSDRLHWSSIHQYKICTFMQPHAKPTCLATRNSSHIVFTDVYSVTHL